MIVHDLPAGSLNIQCLTIPEYISGKWCQYLIHSVIELVTEEFKSSILLLDSLVKAERIRASCCHVEGQTLRIRVFLLNKTTLMPHAPMLHAQNLIQFVDKLDLCPEKFNGASFKSDAVLRQPTLCNMAPKDLLDIFIHMPSPSTAYDTLQDVDPDVLDLLNTVLDQDSPPGMKTTLYPYQKRSLWKILQRELAPQPISGLTSAKCQAVDGRPYYINLLTCQIQTQPDKHRDVRGGIICEDMGTGKTCICLSTILQSKHMKIPSDGKGVKCDIGSKESFPSLTNLAAAQMLRDGTWKLYQPYLPDHILKLMRDNPAYYDRVEYPMSVLVDRPRRVNIPQRTLKVYMASATLVVVPDNLIAQWTGEVYKHIQDGELDFLVLDNKKQPIPPATQLLNYDMVVISHSRFGLESDSGGLEIVGISRKCDCPYIGATRKRDCSCRTIDDPSERYISPLLQVHWKRLIVDEGHSLADSNRSSQLSAKLFVTWKWVCTGTPTQNLTESPVALTRKQAQADDLKRLGILVSNVLNMEPFASKKRSWNTILLNPFMHSNPRASIAVAKLMHRVMIRNRREDISKDVTLPELNKKLVFLDFDYYQWMAHNCQVAMVALNAVLSRREGPDYLFSRGNQKALRETIHNLWQSCLWHSIDPQWLQPAYDNCVEKIDDIDKGLTTYGEEDNNALKEIRDVLLRALNDKLFLAMMTTHSPSYLISNLPDIPRRKWGWLNGQPGIYVENGVPARHAIVSGETVTDITAEVINSHQATDNLWVYDETEDRLETMAQHNRKRKLPHMSGGIEVQEPVPRPLAFIGKSDLYNANVYSTTSSKINYLVNQVKNCHETEKCIIFSQHWNEIQEIYTALRLVRVRAMMYLDSKMSNTERSQTILTFNTSDKVNVIIMSVQVAAYGIDLSSASRVYFVSPVWQTAMEQQAIKRAHRIGQTKPVYVETIVIRSSIEENMLKRRAMLAIKAEKQHNGKASSSKEFYNDRKMQEILNHASFVPLPRTACETGEGEDLNVQQEIDPFDEPVALVKPDDKVDHEAIGLNPPPSVTIEDPPLPSPILHPEEPHRAKRPKVSFQLP
ncbi:P-loop containing nucleoside triphosphate hydrolase protein [Umbelopsis sp. AD052]|nr:P-loop containing nucleoside triphosphate hydrolase protein [Umbelopsis sp. AD052]